MHANPQQMGSRDTRPSVQTTVQTPQTSGYQSSFLQDLEERTRKIYDIIRSEIYQLVDSTIYETRGARRSARFGGALHLRLGSQGTSLPILDQSLSSVPLCPSRKSILLRF